MFWKNLSLSYNMENLIHQKEKLKKKKKISILIYNDIYEHFYIIVFEKHKHFTEKINV